MRSRLRTSGLALLLLAALALGLLPGTDSSAQGRKPIDITVLAPGGKSAAGATVKLMTKKGMRWMGRHRVLAKAETDEQGVAHFDVPGLGSKCTLFVEPPPAIWKETADHVEIDWKPRSMAVYLKKGLPLGGTVVTPSGKPVPWAQVQMDVPRGNRPYYTRAGSDGKFLYERLPPGTVVLEPGIETVGPGMGPGAQGMKVEAGRRDVVLKLRSEPGRLRRAFYVRVVTPDGRPVYGGTVRFDNTTVFKRGTYTSVTGGGTPNNFDGYWAKDINIDNRFIVEVCCPRTYLGELLPYGPGVGGPFGPGPGQATITLKPERSLSGVVKDGDGKGVAGVKIEALPVRQHPSAGIGDPEIGRDVSEMKTPVHGVGWSRADGSFRVGCLGDEPYKLKVHPPPDYSPCRPVSASPGDKDVSIVLRRAAKVTLKILDWRGKPMVGARVTASPANQSPMDRARSHSREVESDKQGLVRLEGLEPGAAYRLEVQPPYDLPDVLTYLKNDWIPSDTEVRLPRGYVIRGMVKDPAGRPVPGAEIVYSKVGSSSRSGNWAGEDGSFAITRLTPGKYAIAAFPPPPEKPRKPDPPGVIRPPMRDHRMLDLPPNPTIVKAGTQDAVVTADMPSALKIRISNWNKRYRGCRAILVAESEGGKAAPQEKKISRTGLVGFEDLDWSVTYALFITPVKGGLCHYRKGLRVPDKGGEIKVALAPGGTVTGKVLGPKGTVSKKVWAEVHGVRIDGKVGKGGAFEIGGLPPGRWPIHASGRRGREPFTGKGEAETGGTLDVQLAPK